MIISPPFLPSAIAGESDEAFLNRAMVGATLGKFPLSYDLNWHGGTHLKAPEENGVPLKVRAIADGEIAYFRTPSEETSDAAHPLNYRGTWTDDGCLVIKHETEIGEGDDAKVVYFSIYMHLSKISFANPSVGQKVYRKDVLGEAGKIYGEGALIHFEIIADQSQIAKLVGRTTRELNHQSSNGRIDSCWGDMYFFVPPEVLAYTTPPTNRALAENNSEVAYRCPSMPTQVPVQEGPSTTSSPPPTVDGYKWEVASQLQNGIFVRMSYKEGDCTLTSYYISGDVIDSIKEEEVNGVKYEFNLYATATKIYPQSPSAGYELLRFGRVLTTDSLNPANAAHWRKIKLPGRSSQNSQAAWVNLNSPTVTKFSDADFPQWQGWNLINDDADTDSHCNSPFIRALLNLDEGKTVADNTDAVGIATSPAYESYNREEKNGLSERFAREIILNQSRLNNDEMKVKLQRLICKFPTEWSKHDFDTRYGWLLKVGSEIALTQEKYRELKNHSQALAFWEEANLSSIGSNHWHLPPTEFINIFKKCPWLAFGEIRSIFPNASSEKIEKYIIHINKTTSKYLITTPLRLSHFFGQSGVETNQLAWMAELYNGDPFEYFRRMEKAKNFAGWLGNIKWNDGGTFRGRGMKQLTGRDNYAKYWLYRGWLSSSSFSDNWWRDPRWWGITGNTVPASQYNTLPTQDSISIQQAELARRPPVIINPDRVNTEPSISADTAGWFWAKNKLLKIADENEISEMTRKIRGDGPNVGISSPWPDSAHFPQRRDLTIKTLKFLGDSHE